MIRKQQQLRDKLQAGPGFAARSHARQAGRSKHGRSAAGSAGPARPAQEIAARACQARHGTGSAWREGSARRGRANRANRASKASKGPRRRRGWPREADSAMGDASGRLGEGNADGAVDSQGRALEALRKGARVSLKRWQQAMARDRATARAIARAGSKAAAMVTIRSGGRCTARIRRRSDGEDSRRNRCAAVRGFWKNSAPPCRSRSARRSNSITSSDC